MDSTIKTELNSENLQGFLTYISGVSSSLLDITKDTIYKESQKPDNLVVIKNFITDQNVKLLCISKVDNSMNSESNEQSSKSDEVLFESELKYKGIKSFTVGLIKKDNSVLELGSTDPNKSLSAQLQILNFNSDANDTNLFLYLQNYMQGAFSPLFNSYQAILGNVTFII